MSKIKRICVYCGSGPGTDPAFATAARAFGKILADSRVGLVFGGGSAGIMGAVAKAAVEHGGEVIGVIPEFLIQREHAMRDGNQLIVTRDLHERKRKMFELADAFVALPGGVGTLEELVEQLTWAQLGRHRKPILIANVKNFWEPLRALFNHMKRLEFIRNGLEFNLLIADTIEDILPKLEAAAAKLPEDEKKLKTAEVGQL